MKPTAPPFELRDVTACTLRMSGRSGERVGALDLDEDIYLVVRARVVEIAHVEADTGTIERRHKAKVTAMSPLTQAQGEVLMTDATAAADEAFGIVHLFNPRPGDDDTPPAPRAPRPRRPRGPRKS